MEKLTFILLIAITVVQGPGPDHHHDHHENHDPNQPHPEHECQGAECDIVNMAIHDIGAHFDDHVCHVFKDLNCDHHVLPDDEQICGSDGITYADHCLFVKARCVTILDHHHEPLNIVKHGPCVDPSSTSSAPAIVSTSFASATATSAHVNLVQPINNVLGSVFCKYKSIINCSTKIEVVCGSDGSFYPNMCELMMIQCDNPTLKAVNCMILP